jgi:hypothetical protein
MAEPLILFGCHACGRQETVQIGVLQLVGSQPWFDADGWRVRRNAPHTVRCAACWQEHPLAASGAVEVVRTVPKTE